VDYFQYKRCLGVTREVNKHEQSLFKGISIENCLINNKYSKKEYKNKKSETVVKTVARRGEQTQGDDATFSLSTQLKRCCLLLVCRY
jgi:hypothetical protein